MHAPRLVILAVWLFVAGYLSHVDAAGCHGAADPGVPNEFPILEGASAMTLISSNAHGKRYEVTVPNGGGSAVSTFPLLHVFGTPYEMGYAQGVLMSDQANAFVTTVWAYLQEEVDQNLPNYFPKWFADLIADLGLDLALDFTIDATAYFTGEWFYEEMHGLADGAGLDYDTLLKLHMIAGLTQGKCSMLGAWGDATANGHLIQLRALDWNMDGPFRNFSQVTVYHPQGLGHAFASVS